MLTLLEGALPAASLILDSSNQANRSSTALQYRVHLTPPPVYLYLRSELRPYPSNPMPRPRKSSQIPRYDPLTTRTIHTIIRVSTLPPQNTDFQLDSKIPLAEQHFTGHVVPHWISRLPTTEQYQKVALVLESSRSTCCKCQINALASIGISCCPQREVSRQARNIEIL
jgi:hypothetical protein